MAWDFSTDPEFEAQLEWMRGFVRDEIIPLETLDIDQPTFDRITAPLKERVKERGLWAAHLPQVAARANHHFLVSKETAHGATRSHIAVLDRDSRVGEVARMLGGLTVTEATRQHAHEMLAGPSTPPATAARDTQRANTTRGARRPNRANRAEPG